MIDLDGDGCSGRLGKLFETGSVVLKPWEKGRSDLGSGAGPGAAQAQAQAQNLMASGGILCRSTPPVLLVLLNLALPLTLHAQAFLLARNPAVGSLRARAARLVRSAGRCRVAAGREGSGGIWWDLVGSGGIWWEPVGI